ncbi:hypothetical protein Dimus_005583, partial [Dionaea muscipula]
ICLSLRFPSSVLCVLFILVFMDGRGAGLPVRESSSSDELGDGGDDFQGCLIASKFVGIGFVSWLPLGFTGVSR